MNLLMLIVYIVYTGISGNHSDRPVVNQLGPPSSAWMEFNEKYDRTRIDIDEAEQLSLKSAFRDIENAYTNYQVEAMETAMIGVSNRIDRVQDRYFKDLHWGLYRFFTGYFIHNMRLYDSDTRRRKFDASTDFERFLEAHMKMAIFLGECYCRRNDYYDVSPMLIEVNVFDVLKTCIDRFHKEGRWAFEEITQKSLDMWITHIESEQGFIRRYAHWGYERDMALIGVRGMTREQAISAARRSAELLIRYGYTPKWLDEFK